MKPEKLLFLFLIANGIISCKEKRLNSTNSNRANNPVDLVQQNKANNNDNSIKLTLYSDGENHSFTTFPLRGENSQSSTQLNLSSNIMNVHIDKSGRLKIDGYKLYLSPGCYQFLIHKNQNSLLVDPHKKYLKPFLQIDSQFLSAGEVCTDNTSAQVNDIKIIYSGQDTDLDILLNKMGLLPQIDNQESDLNLTNPLIKGLLSTLFSSFKKSKAKSANIKPRGVDLPKIDSLSTSKQRGTKFLASSEFFSEDSIRRLDEGFKTKFEKNHIVDSWLREKGIDSPENLEIEDLQYLIREANQKISNKDLQLELNRVLLNKINSKPEINGRLAKFVELDHEPVIKVAGIERVAKRLFEDTYGKKVSFSVVEFLDSKQYGDALKKSILEIQESKNGYGVIFSKSRKDSAHLSPILVDIDRKKVYLLDSLSGTPHPAKKPNRVPSDTVRKETEFLGQTELLEGFDYISFDFHRQRDKFTCATFCIEDSLTFLENPDRIGRFLKKSSIKKTSGGLEGDPVVKFYDALPAEFMHLVQSRKQIDEYLLRFPDEKLKNATDRSFQTPNDDTSKVVNLAAISRQNHLWEFLIEEAKVP